MAGGHALRPLIRRQRGHKTGRTDNKLPQGWGASPAIPHDLPRVPDGKRQREVGCHHSGLSRSGATSRTISRSCGMEPRPRDGVPEATNKTKRHLQHLTTWGRGTLHHDDEPLKEEGSRTGHTHRSSWKGGQSSLHPGRLPPAHRAGAEPRRGHLIWRCCGRESKKSHGRAAGTRLGPLTPFWLKPLWGPFRLSAALLLFLSGLRTQIPHLLTGVTWGLRLHV